MLESQTKATEEQAHFTGPFSAQFAVGLQGQDQVTLVSGHNQTWEIQAVGCAAFLAGVQNLLQQHPDPHRWTAPQGSSHVAVLLRELVDRIQGRFALPVQAEEICHCRMVKTEVVDHAIVAGAETVEQVRRWTSASSACGTCRPDIEKLLQYRRPTVAQGT